MLKDTKNTKKIDVYRINFDRLLGSGGVSQVYEAQHIKTGEKFTAKIMNKNMEKCLTKSVQREVQIMKDVRHPNIIRMQNFRETENNYYIFLELADSDLDKLLKKDGKISQKKAIGYIKQLINGYKQLFNLNVIHRDLKPANLFLQGNTIKIGDFGFCRYNCTINEKFTFGVGTTKYMAPQVIVHKEKGYSNKCDVWSLGVICYELVTGKMPWPYYQDITADEIIYVLMFMPQYRVQFKDDMVSELYRDFVSGCLGFNIDGKRFSWKQVFEHPLFKED